MLPRKVKVVFCQGVKYKAPLVILKTGCNYYIMCFVKGTYQGPLLFTSWLLLSG